MLVIYCQIFLSVTFPADVSKKPCMETHLDIKVFKSSFKLSIAFFDKPKSQSPNSKCISGCAINSKLCISDVPENKSIPL